MRFCYIVADVLDKYNKPLLRESKKSVHKSIKESDFKSDVISFINMNNIKYTKIKLAKHGEEIWIYGNGGQIVISEWEWNRNEHDKDYADMIAYAIMNDNEIDSFYESKKSVHKSIKEKSIYDKEFSIAVSNALKYGEEWNIPFKYSDDDDFTKGLEKYLEDKDYVFSGSFVTKEYGLVHEYKDKGSDETDFWTVYLVIDKSFKSSGICVGILGEL